MKCPLGDVQLKTEDKRLKLRSKIGDGDTDLGVVITERIIKPMETDEVIQTDSVKREED